MVASVAGPTLAATVKAMINEERELMALADEFARPWLAALIDRSRDTGESFITDRLADLLGPIEKSVGYRWNDPHRVKALDRADKFLSATHPVAGTRDPWELTSQLFLLLGTRHPPRDELQSVGFGIAMRLRHASLWSPRLPRVPETSTELAWLLVANQIGADSRSGDPIDRSNGASGAPYLRAELESIGENGRRVVLGLARQWSGSAEDLLSAARVIAA